MIYIVDNMQGEDKFNNRHAYYSFHPKPSINFDNIPLRMSYINVSINLFSDIELFGIVFIKISMCRKFRIMFAIFGIEREQQLNSTKSTRCECYCTLL